MKENKKTNKKNKFDVGKELRKFLRCSKNWVSLDEVRKETEEKWPDVDKRTKRKKQ